MVIKLSLRCALLLLAASGAAAPASSIDRLGWMQGCWMVTGTEPGSGEQWSSAAGGSMIGMSRTVKAGKTVEFEFIQIREVSPGKLTFIAQPSGKPPTSFPLARQDGNAFVFESAGQDFPQRVIYRPDGKQGMHARVEGMVKGKLEAIDFPMQRVRCEAAPRI
jgi:hypothetical protein